MPRLSRRDRRIRAAAKRQLYIPDPVIFAEPWDDDDECDLIFDDEALNEEAPHEHA